ncbi:MAG: hypothetical protein HY673_16735 [Chloroflexi bacterium]|nr:hypothetical protein [Chloroflexota bacterium]
MEAFEQETIIVFNKAEATASIFTYERTWQNHLEQRLGLKPVLDNGHGGKEYELPKRLIRPPAAPRRLSPEARAKAIERLRRNRPEMPYRKAESARESASKGVQLSRSRQAHG